MLKSPPSASQSRRASPVHPEATLLDAYRKFRSLLRRPVWLTVAARDSAMSDSHDDADDVDDVPPVVEAPDTSHVAPPPAELPPVRDEAIELLARRLDVLATRADRSERSIEALAPARIADMPTRAELRALETIALSNREHGQLLDRRIAETREGEATFAQARVEDRAAVAELKATNAKLESRLRDLGEEVQEIQRSRNEAADSLRDLREAMLDQDAARAAESSRRLAGAYTVALVALLAALLTLVLVLTK